MSFKYSELDRLQDDLIATADRDARDDRALLRDASLGARGILDPFVAQVVATLAGRLYHQPSNQLVRQLCRGALVVAVERRADAREMLTFALQVVQQVSGASPLPGSIALPEATAKKARENLLQHTARPEPVDRLTRAVREFAQTNDAVAESLMFARFIGNLEFLSDVLRDESRPDSVRRTAAGALTYFVEKHDAIDDELGVVGVLDDAYVAQLAAEDIDPSRRVSTALVDAMVVQWPFLARLRLGTEADGLDGGHWAPSEFALLNLAVAFGPEAALRTAIVLPTIVAQMPLWLGVFAALGAIYQNLPERSASFRPQVGEFISVSGHHEHVFEIVGYKLQAPDGRPMGDATAQTAHWVGLKYLPRSRKARAPVVTEWKPVRFLDTCVPASPRPGRRACMPPSRRSDVSLGPLEQLFALHQPLRLDATLRRIVVVCPLGESRSFLSETSLQGRALADLIPCGRVVREDGYRIDWWSALRTGDTPVLTIARDLPEAAALLSRCTVSADVAVLTTLDRDEWDAAALKQLGDVHLTALIPQRHFEMQTALATEGFRFLDWTPDLERSVSHPPRMTSCVVNSYETLARRQLHSKVAVHAVELESVELGLSSLKEFSKSVREDYGDEVPAPLARWAETCQRHFFELGGAPMALDGLLVTKMEAAFADLRGVLGGAGRTWSGRCTATAKVHLEALASLLRDLHAANPKAEALSDVLQDKRVVVYCSSDKRWDQLVSHYPDARRWRSGGSRGECPVVIFEWPGIRRLQRLLLPPLGDVTHAVFYKWEREALGRVEKARAKQLAEHWTPRIRPSAWHLEDLPTHVSAALQWDDRPDTLQPLEEWLVGLRRQGVVSSAQARGEADTLIDATPVYFTGNQYCLFSNDREVLVATNLHGVSQARDSESMLDEKPPRKLQPGDIVVIRAGSERDAIRELADAHLPVGARALARTWHVALVRLRERCGSEKAVAQALHAAGCTRTDFTIYWWLRSPTQIGPHDPADIDFIARATGDEELISRLDECKRAVHLVRGAHLRASHELSVSALNALEARLSRGEAIDVKIELGNGLQLLTVEGVDAKAVSVPRSTTNVVQDLS